MLLDVWLPVLALASIPMISGNGQFAVVMTSCKWFQKTFCCVVLELILVGACAQMRKSLMCCELIVMARRVGSDLYMVMSLDCIWSIGVDVVLFCLSCCWR